MDWQAKEHAYKHGAGLEERVGELLRLASHACGLHAHEYLGGETTRCPEEECQNEHDQLGYAASSIAVRHCYSM